jgi:4-hydroxy-tetrahydrodipicolinate reductase
MGDRLNIVVAGATGRIGQALIRAIAADDSLQLVGAVERHDHPDLAKDVGLLAAGRILGVNLENDIRNVVLGAKAIIDFTAPEASLWHAEIAARYETPLVVGTTGLDEKQRARLATAAERTAIVLAPNMSLGVNLLFYLARRAAEVIGADSDIEIVETHHRHKVDAPSGTALKLAEIVGTALGYEAPTEYYDQGRSGAVGPRAGGHIGLHAVRGGEVGRHELHFFGLGEELCLTHNALSRDNFVRGAIRAARWLQGKQPGLYDMGDVLGLR